jgi:hypothetical protein
LPTPSEGSPSLPIAELESYLCGYEDLSYLEQFLRKHKACRLALAALESDPFNPNNPSISPLEEPSSSKEPSATSVEPSEEHSSEESSTPSQIPSIPEDDFFQAAIITTQNILEFPLQFTLKSGFDYLSTDYILNNGNDGIMDVFRGMV